jgi:hypothetical protein
MQMLLLIENARHERHSHKNSILYEFVLIHIHHPDILTMNFILIHGIGNFLDSLLQF